MLKPERLRAGDCVGIVSPSAGAAGLFPHRLRRGVAALKALGLRVKVSKNALKTTGHTAGTPRERAADLNAMFADDSVKAIVCAIGGNHSNQVLPHLDYALIRSRPKILTGFSDITVLHLALLARTGLTTFYGPALLTQFAENPAPLPYTLDHFMRCVSLPRPLGVLAPSKRWTDELLDWRTRADERRPRRLRANLGPFWLAPGRCRGRLIGGCITSLMHLRGTRYWPDFKDAVFFWESPEGAVLGRGRSVADIESCLADLDLSGVFDRIAGMVIGRPYGYDAAEKNLFYDAVRRVLGRRRLPVLAGVDIGHTDPMLTLPIGARARLDSARGEFEILDAGVK